MPPHGVSNWRRPYTSIYNDNYKYGTGLYNDTLTDIEKRYSESLSKTQLRSDRRDLNFATFADSTLTGSPSPGMDLGTTRETRSMSRQKSVPSPMDEISRSSTFESRLNSAYHSSYALDEDVQDAINARKEQRLQKALARNAVEQPPLSSSSRPKSLYDDAVFWSLPKPTENPSSDFETTRNKKKFGGETSTNGPRVSQWREKSRVIQEQVETLERNLSDCNGKLNTELSSLKSKCHNEIADLHKSVEHTSDQANDLQKVCKRQAHQLLELQSAYEDSQRCIQDALEEMNLWQNRCKTLKKEMDKLREEIEVASIKANRD